MSPRTIPGTRLCEICGSLLKGYQLRFCSIPCSLEWNHHHRPTRRKQAATLKAMMARGEMPKPPRATGPFKYSPETRAAIHLVKTGSRIADLTPEQQILFRDYNRGHSREQKARARGKRGTDGG